MWRRISIHRINSKPQAIYLDILPCGLCLKALCRNANGQGVNGTLFGGLFIALV